MSILLGMIISIGLGLILFSPILPIAQWTNILGKILLPLRYRQGIHNADK